MKKNLKIGDKVKFNLKNYGIIEGTIMKKGTVQFGTATWTVQTSQGFINLGSKHLTKISN